jgi:pilus assembly protein CpaB
MRIFLFIFAALAAAGGTGFYLYGELQAPSQGGAVTALAEAPKSKEVFVPATELAAGTIIQVTRLSRMEVAEASLTPEMIVADEAGLAILTGSVPRQTLARGMPIARSAIVQPGDRGFLAAVLPRGKRAISIPLSETAGMSGLVLPGDRVDIILTYSVAGENIDAGRDIRASETVATNLRVVALDHRTDAAQSLIEKDGVIVAPPIARTATLEVTPQQAEMITLATTLGDLALVLNSVRDGGDPEPEATETLEIAAADGSPAAIPGAISDAMTEPLALASSARRAATLADATISLRGLTLDSDVTSLLRREVRAAAQPQDASGASPVPLEDRKSHVQIVRGTDSRAVMLGAIDALAPAQPSASPPTAD